MMYRAEAIATAFAIAAIGTAVGVTIIVRCLLDAVDAALTLPRAHTVPNTVPAAWSEMHR